MFSFHKPRVYRSPEGCCICRAKSSSSRFTDSTKYEDDSVKCFNLNIPRQGEICNACVLLVKRFKRLPVGSNRHWGHVVDARVGPGMKSMSKFKKQREENFGKSMIPEKFAKIFKKTKKKQEKEKTKKESKNSARSVWHNCTTNAVDTTGKEAIDRLTVIKNENKIPNQRINRRKLKLPKKLKSNKDDHISFIDENLWRTVTSRCGTVYENINVGAVIMDTTVYYKLRQNQQDSLIKTNKIETKSVVVSSIQKTEMKRPSITITKQTNNQIKQTTVLKKHHLYFKRQSENFPTGDILTITANPSNSNTINNKTDNTNNSSMSSVAIASTQTQTQTQKVQTSEIISKHQNSNNNKSSSFLHKIKVDTGKIVKHSLDKINPLRVKQADLYEMKTLFKTVDKPYIIKAMNDTKLSTTNKKAAVINPETTLVQQSSAATKFNDNSSDSGFDENLQDRKSVSPMAIPAELDKKFANRPIQTMFLASGVQIQGQQQNLVLTGNEVAAKILQSRRQPQSIQNLSNNNTTASKVVQMNNNNNNNSNGSQKIRAILNQQKLSEGGGQNSLASLTLSSATIPVINKKMLNLMSPAASSLNQKIILVKTKYNHNQSSSVN